MSRIPPRRKPRRVRSELFFGHKRVVLRGRDRVVRRAEIFERAGGRCEEEKEVHTWNDNALYHEIEYQRCFNQATEWSHKQHGQRKCDCMECGIASCADCHRKRHQPKAVPAK